MQKDDPMNLRCIVFSALVFLLSVNGFSQSQTASGDIKGTVADVTGAVLPGAAITVTNINTRVERSGTSDSAGGFRFFLLPPADYEVRIQVPGFSIYTRRPVQVTVGEVVSVDAVLQPASVQQEVLVQEVVSQVEPEKTQQSDTITDEQINKLPINQRNFLNFSLLTPGVTDARAHISFTLPQAPTSGLSFLGQSGRTNNVTIDGVDNNDNAVASVRSTMSQEAVQEFQINRSNFSAEFGRSGGGLRHESFQRRRFRISPQSIIGCAESLRIWSQRQRYRSGLQPSPDRLHSRRADQTRSNLLLPRLRRPPTTRVEFRDVYGKHDLLSA
jgi:hypothetical protein